MTTMRLWCMSVVCFIVVVEVDLLSAAVVSDPVQPVERQVTAGRLTPLAWPASLRSGRHRRSAQGKGFQYAVVVDAGSSGSRVHVYRWPTPGDDTRVALQAPGVENNYTKKIKPGLSAHAHDLQRISTDIYGILSDAAQHVPRQLQRTSPVYIMATAGMRLQLERRMNSVVRYISSLMSNSSFQPFKYPSKHNTRVLSGEEEGVFAWIAVNYLRGVFSNNRRNNSRSDSHDEMAGILEMGGASTQIAFAPRGDILADKFPVLIGGRRYPLYVHSYLYYGQNAVDDRIKNILVAESDNSSQSVQHPCMLRGDTVLHQRLNRTFVGTGDVSACLHLLNQLVHKVELSDCYPKPCAIGNFYQPTIAPTIPFYAVGSFHYALEAIGAVNSDGIYVPRTGFEKASEFCAKHIDEVVSPTTSAKQRGHVSNRCLIALYTAILFTRGYGFSNDTQQIHVELEINGQPPDWSLGAVLYEDELTAIHECELSPQTAEVRGSDGHKLTARWITVLLLGLLCTLQ